MGGLAEGVITVADAYQDFLARKALVAPATGIPNPPPLSPKLKDHQALLTAWALRRGRAAIFADTGLGKGFCILEWARVVAEHTGRPSLILAPLAVSQQFQREAEKFGRSVTVAASQDDVESEPACDDQYDEDIRPPWEPRVYVTNYQKLHKFDPSVFGGVALDECFAKGTRVAVVHGDGADKITVNTPIEDVRVGDRIYNASGIDTVSDVHRREVPYAVRVRVADSTVTCSPNHPFFTQRGWVGAQDLVPGDVCLRTASAVRMVRLNVRSQVQAEVGASCATVLREILLSEMADAPAGDRCQSSLRRSCGEEGSKSFGMVEVWAPGRGCRGGTNTETQSYERSEGVREDLAPIERDEPRSFRAWGERAWIDAASADSTGCTWAELAHGICLVTGPADSRLSNALQDRLGERRSENRHRSGWQLSPGECQEGAGREEVRDAAFARVDGFEVLEPGHPDLERLRSPDGKLYFYDLGGTRHPSFSVNGILVHNSSILKSLDGKTRTQLIAAFRDTPFKLCATATPSPNDHTELGGQAQFLGIMSHQEMLATFFIHDAGKTQDWRLKGHAREAFWRWCTSWGAIVKLPSDLGCDDSGYILPELRYHEHIIPATKEDAARTGMLFAQPAETLGDQRAARRGTLESRCQVAADIVNALPDGEQAIVWCDLNVESEWLKRNIRGAEEVTGSQPDDEKEAAIARFLSGQSRVLVSKASICGHGLNLQQVHTVVFCGVSHSFEQFYQAVRRCWRFGQLFQVDVHVISSELEGRVVENLKAKQRKAEELSNETRGYVQQYIREMVAAQGRQTIPYDATKRVEWPSWLRTEVQGG